jgi:cell filamentation protein
MDHPYCYPGTDVYRNKENLQDKDEFEAFERLHSADRLLTLPYDLPITVDGYREIHRYIFQDVYDWAGEYRTVTTGRGAPFCKAEYIAAEMDKRFTAINAEDNLRGLTAEEFAARAAERIEKCWRSNGPNSTNEVDDAKEDFAAHRRGDGGQEATDPVHRLGPGRREPR